MSISDYLEAALLDAVFNNTSYAAANTYAKIHIGDPGEAGTSNPAGETTRKVLSFGAAASPGGTVTSDADAAWTNVSTTETYSHISLWDNLTAGNCLWSGALTVAKAVSAGDNFTIPSGSLVCTLS